LLLFFRYSFIRAWLTVRIILWFDNAIDHPVKSVKSCCSYYPLLYHDYRPVFKFRGHGTKVLSRKNITPSFEDSEHKEIYVPSLSGSNEEVHKMPSFLISEEGFMYLLILYSELRLSYFITQLKYVTWKCGVLLEVSTSCFCTEVPTQSLQSISYLLWATALVKPS